MQPSIFYTALGRALRRASFPPSAACAIVPQNCLCPSGQNCQAIGIDQDGQYRSSSTLPFGGSAIRRIHTTQLGASRTSTAPSKSATKWAANNGDPAPEQELSRRKQKARRTAPSKLIIDALKYLDHHQALPASFPKKLDLSYNNPRARRPDGLVGKAVYAPGALTLPGILAVFLKEVMPVLYSETQTAAWSAQLDHALLRVFNEKVSPFLEDRGYSEHDVITWAWITTAPTAKDATLRMWAAENPTSVTDRIPKRTPTFVFLFILRREDINAKDLKMLMAHAWTRLKGTSPIIKTETPERLEDVVPPATSSHQDLQVSDSKIEEPRKLDETTIMTMVVRLLRHARKVWPQAIVSIAEMVSQHLNGLQDGRSGMSPEVSARLTCDYNRVLSLLAQPSSLNPYLVLPYHQRAQFNLIKRMTTFDPPLVITQEGFRAVTKIQVAHKKTIEERKWAQKKALSWPPWKEEKLGIDTIRGPDDGKTRATHVMTQMKEAGYVDGWWERTARIYSGWDTDHSPTIQTRTFLDKPPSGSSSKLESSRFKAASICAARIRATRTLDEAWASFLSHQDAEMNPSGEMYFAMFEKLASADRQRKRNDSAESERSEADPGTIMAQRELDQGSEEVAPGDSKEVHPPPVSPQDAVYLRTPLPTSVTLFKDMMDRGIEPSEACVAFLVQTSTTFRTGLDYIATSKILKPSQLDSLMGKDIGRYHGRDEGSRSRDIKDIPRSIFTAYIDLLCRQPSVQRPVGSRSGDAIQGSSTEAAWSNIASADPPSNPLLFAHQLLRKRRSRRSPPYRPSWNALLGGISRRGAIVTDSPRQVRPAEQDILSWKLMQQVVREMSEMSVDLDVQGFHSLCTGLEKAMAACREVDFGTAQPGVSLESAITPEHEAAVKAGVEDIVENGSLYVKAAFQNLVGVDSPSDPEPQIRVSEVSSDPKIDPSILLPSLLAVPGPAQLHAYMRVLGLSRDFDGVLGLAQWMIEYAPDLEAVVHEARNGKRMLRRTLVAMRLFLEDGNGPASVDEEDESDDAAQDNRAGEDLIEHVKDLVNGQESWGGWPEDDEVEAYRLAGRRR